MAQPKSMSPQQYQSTVLVGIAILLVLGFIWWPLGVLWILSFSIWERLSAQKYRENWDMEHLQKENLRMARAWDSDCPPWERRKMQARSPKVN